jgi:hypothetical protein
MADKHKVGEVRRSQIVMTYGPGSLMNLKSGNATISIIMGDLDSWDFEQTGRTKIAKNQWFVDMRLAKSIEAKYELKVDKFKLAPIEASNKSEGFDNEFSHKANLIGNIFPKMMICRKCHRIKHFNDWEPDSRSQRRYCPRCSIPPKKLEYVLPSRFVTACQNGHIDEFPYHWWLMQRGKNLSNDCSHEDLILEQKKGLGLGSLFLKCNDCGGFASMNGIFSSEGLKGLSCSGKNPWRMDEQENIDSDCSAPVKAQQRNSKSLWQPIPVSAIFVPPWDDKTANKIGDWWPRILKKSSKEDRKKAIDIYLDDINDECHTEYTSSRLHELIEKEVENNNKSNIDLKIDEYLAFTKHKNSINHPHFSTREMKVPDELKSYITQVSEVTKLREVRALVGFKRLNGFDEKKNIGRDIIFEVNKNINPWLPALEVFGEGFFIEFDHKKILKYIKDDPIAKKDVAKITVDMDDIEKKYVFLHSLSHIVMKGASIEAGYSLSSIRERIYAGDNQCGILIYTSASDSEGTLGGLSRLAKSERMSRIFKNSYINASQCSSDPLCSYGALSASEEQNGSVCHSCLLLPETSCENFNSRLSRIIVENFLHQENV